MIEPIMANHSRGVMVTAIAGFVTGGGVQRALVYVSKVMPPLPANAGWWAQFCYWLVKGVSGLDPNSTISGGK